MDLATVYIALACVFGLFMAWGVGANDVANAMSTSVGSKAVTIRQAIIIAAIFEFAGAYLAGGEVTATIRNGMIDTRLLADRPDLLIYGMLASLLAAGTWLTVASFFGWPVSTTHSIVGAIVGFAAIGIGMEAVHWGKISNIALSWVISPLLSGTLAYLLFMSVQGLILNTAEPLKAAIRYVPGYIFVTALVTALVTLTKGLKHIGLDLGAAGAIGWSLMLAAVVAAFGLLAIRRLRLDPALDRTFQFANVERVFGVLMIVTACAMAFAHGSNDVANAVGPVAAIVGIVASGSVAAQSAVPPWVLLLGAVGIVLGLITFGRRVIATVGSRITDLTPSRGFAATLAAATTVVAASGIGLPISTTHTLVGAVLGVGLARGIAALNLSVIRTIFVSWVITLPAGAVLSIIFFYILRASFS
ncbi:inorganic phosphate transporter [Flagellatimonas centrodinii]|uniref:inorganic phosphate transporter n=1 Tax=Flagellatimonas centrodinii TaxID=2806210 RepID=UPI001FF020F0|nr:inorganic phosphate transporter [Flagellatimonas centrodinii]ULQ45772.1 inorganic phosphate transporter [Flagellatimonas centrodinii]